MNRHQIIAEGYRCLSRCIVFISIVTVTMMLFSGCSHISERYTVRSTLKEANDLFNRGDYKASMMKYEQVMEKYPDPGDQALYEMGLLYAYPWNEQKDYQKSIACFQKILTDYPGSPHKLNCEVMISLAHNVTLRDKRMNTKQTQLELMELDLKTRDDQITELKRKLEALAQDVYMYRHGPAERILIEKKERQLTLIAKNKVLKTYKIALGGNPQGHKIMQGDQKTPEGLYYIDARNKNSEYHLSLHISYPNEKDKKRAAEMGVSPGGDIMIHGLKKGSGWIGASHTREDWTQGCIAVTDDEIEEIEKMAPNGTIVEIKP